MRLATRSIEMTITSQRESGIDRLLDDAWTVDCAIRLRQPAWATAAAESLIVELARHEQGALQAWSDLDPATGEALAATARAVQAQLPALADELRRGTSWPRPDVYQRIEQLIHNEAIAVGDAAWRLAD
jgi:hypothetical protein